MNRIFVASLVGCLGISGIGQAQKGGKSGGCQHSMMGGGGFSQSQMTTRFPMTGGGGFSQSQMVPNYPMTSGGFSQSQMNPLMGSYSQSQMTSSGGFSQSHRCSKTGGGFSQSQMMTSGGGYSQSMMTSNTPQMRSGLSQSQKGHSCSTSRGSSLISQNVPGGFSNSMNSRSNLSTGMNPFQPRISQTSFSSPLISSTSQSQYVSTSSTGFRGTAQSGYGGQSYSRSVPSAQSLSYAMIGKGTGKCSQGLANSMTGTANYSMPTTMTSGIQPVMSSFNRGMGNSMAGSMCNQVSQQNRMQAQMMQSMMNQADSMASQVSQLSQQWPQMMEAQTGSNWQSMSAAKKHARICQAMSNSTPQSSSQRRAMPQNMMASNTSGPVDTSTGQVPQTAVSQLSNPIDLGSRNLALPAW